MSPPEHNGITLERIRTIHLNHMRSLGYRRKYATVKKQVTPYSLCRQGAREVRGLQATEMNAERNAHRRQKYTQQVRSEGSREGIGIEVHHEDPALDRSAQWYFGERGWGRKKAFEERMVWVLSRHWALLRAYRGRTRALV